ncbi:hypothetical protein VOM14_18620 [Paraburkholderia sp. MPAMCS5]|uniref:hypothetical protein n=1 Tax=Paraburkholderia sp. MPAMCS5 TaxID=3112563 RepID=UPI002E16EB09|nr:hypothetical protein [Paraburkholderia sp. MPAMCS5]
MDDSIEIEETKKRATTAELASTLVELVEILLTDVATDVEVVARELGLRDEKRERLRRALDRVGCARGVLEATRQIGLGQPKQLEQPKESGRVTEVVSAEGGTCGGRDVDSSDGHERDDSLDVVERVGGAVLVLAGDWPQDYPSGAVEWLILDAMERPAG